MTQSDLNILVVDQDNLRASVLEDGLRDAGYGSVTAIVPVERLTLCEYIE